MRLRSARRDGRGGQACAEVPHLLARCAACVAAGTPHGRPLSRMSKPSKKPAKCRKCARLDRARVALQIISTWATFEGGAVFRREDVLALATKVLRELK
jgi:hypothetical protein